MPHRIQSSLRAAASTEDPEPINRLLASIRRSIHQRVVGIDARPKARPMRPCIRTEGFVLVGYARALRVVWLRAQEQSIKGVQAASIDSDRDRWRVAPSHSGPMRDQNARWVCQSIDLGGWGSAAPSRLVPILIHHQRMPVAALMLLLLLRLLLLAACHNAPPQSIDQLIKGLASPPSLPYTQGRRAGFRTTTAGKREALLPSIERIIQSPQARRRPS